MCSVRRFLPLVIAASSVLSGALISFSAQISEIPSVPLVVEVSEDVSGDFAGVPALQSFAAASWHGKWVLIGGRTNGYHALGGKSTDFARTEANLDIWVIDTTAAPGKRVFHTPVASLPDNLTKVKDQWVASNFLSHQDGDTLYIAGGYGETSNHEWVTYPLISSISLPILVQDVISGNGKVGESISFAESPVVQSSGGGLLKLDDGFFYLVMGHVFMGRYGDFEANNENNQPKVWQKYLGEIRKLKISQASNHSLTVTQLAKFNDPEFLRRDLNVTYAITQEGKVGAATYGGVFTKDQLSFSKPIYFDSHTQPRVDSYDQKMSAYACANMVLYDRQTKTTYTTFFGGISRWLWNYKTGQFELTKVEGDKTKEVYLDGMEWTDQISTLVHRVNSTSEFVQPKNRLPTHGGTEAIFFRAADAAVVQDSPILDLSQFRGRRVLAGYIFGGIDAFPKRFPYRDESETYRPGAVPTRCSNKILKVYVTAPAGT